MLHFSHKTRTRMLTWGSSIYLLAHACLVQAQARPQPFEAIFTQREQREIAREFLPSREAIISLQKALPIEAVPTWAVGGGLSVALERASDGVIATAIPAELKLTHNPSGVEAKFSTELQNWVRDGGETFHGVGAFGATLTAKWVVVPDQSNLRARIGVTLDSGSDVSDPNSRSVALLYGQKLSDLNSIVILGSLLHGPRAASTTFSRNVLGASARVNHKFGSGNQHAAWAKLSTSHRDGANTAYKFAAGIDFAVVPDRWEGTLSVVRGLSHTNRTTSVSVEFGRSFSL